MKKANSKSLVLIAKAIFVHRKRAGLSRRELSEMAQVSETAIYEIEKANSGARLETLLNLFSILNIHLKLDGPFMQEVLSEGNDHAQS